MLRYQWFQGVLFTQEKNTVKVGFLFVFFYAKDDILASENNLNIIKFQRHIPRLFFV